jgi:hypothetical protein
MIPDERREAKTDRSPAVTDGPGHRFIRDSGRAITVGCSHLSSGWQDREVRIASWRAEDIESVQVPVPV